jgi:hypothetical protein
MFGSVGLDVCSGRTRRELASCTAGHLFRVRLTERALCLNDYASNACFRRR